MDKMLRNKIFYFKKIYNLGVDHFYGSYIFSLSMKNIIKNKKIYAE